MVRGGGVLMRRVNPPSEGEKKHSHAALCVCEIVCQKHFYYREGIEAIWTLAEWTSG